MNTFSDRVAEGYRYRKLRSGQYYVTNPVGVLYRVTTGPDRTDNTCSCKAGQFGNTCKHLKDCWLLDTAMEWKLETKEVELV